MELFQEILKTIIEVILIPAIPVVCKLGYDYIKTWAASKTAQIENEKVQLLLRNAAEVIDKAVDNTTQTFVEELKKSDKFDDKAVVEAFNRSKDTAMSMLTEGMIDVINTTFGDFDTWLQTSIEQRVYASKKKYTEMLTGDSTT